MEFMEKNVIKKPFKNITKIDKIRQNMSQYKEQIKAQPPHSFSKAALQPTME